MSDRKERGTSERVVIVTGPSGAGRATAINALEDLGYESIDNLPISLLSRVFAAPGLGRLALGIDVRNRDFSVDSVLAILRGEPDAEVMPELLYLDCEPGVLIRRYSETRRRHPLAPAETPDIGIAREIDLLSPVREKADHLVNTSDMTPHDLRAELERLFGDPSGRRLSVSIESFSYKRGLPRGADMVFDVRFLANPHWEPSLKDKDGRAGDVADYVAADPRYPEFFHRVRELILSLVPAFVDEGKTYLGVAIGCTGGQHRSVAVAEKLAKALEDQGVQVSTRHRELERRGMVRPPRDMGMTT